MGKGYHFWGHLKIPLKLGLKNHLLGASNKKMCAAYIYVKHFPRTLNIGSKCLQGHCRWSLLCEISCVAYVYIFLGVLPERPY